MTDLEDRIIDIDIDSFDIDSFDIDPEEPLWDKLIQKIIDGKVIPVIGSGLLTVNNMSIHRYIIEGLGRKYGMAKKPQSFSDVVYSPEYKKEYGNRESIYFQINKFFDKKTFPVSQQLRRLLSIRQFPFVITTSFTPVVEQAMKEIWKEELKVMRFNNNPKENDDIKTGTDLRKPTVYHMFGRVGEGAHKYVLTDTDMLDFVASWLSNDSKARPKNLCNELKDKYLLMLGNDYSNWLFRFIWYSMRKPDLGHGMLAYDTLDEQLIYFLERAETFTKQNTSGVIDEIITRLEKKVKEDENEKFDIPMENMDVFISYSRRDSDVAENLYKSLTAQGKRVWYDKKNLSVGDNFMDEIRQAIRTSKYFVPIFSENITKEKGESHTYRYEWDTAISVAISKGCTYIIPIAEDGFDFYEASIPERIQQYNAITYRKDEIDRVAEMIIHKMNQD